MAVEIRVAVMERVFARVLVYHARYMVYCSVKHPKTYLCMYFDKQGLRRLRRSSADTDNGEDNKQKA